MKIIYLTYNYDPNAFNGSDISTNIFIGYFIQEFKKENFFLINLNHNNADVNLSCKKVKNSSVKVWDIYPKNNIQNALYSIVSDKTSKAKPFLIKDIINAIEEILAIDPIGNSHIKIIFNSIVTLNFYNNIDYYFQTKNITKLEFIYLAENIQNSLYPQVGKDFFSDKFEKLEHKKILKLEEKLHLLDKIICFSNGDLGYLSGINAKRLNGKIVYPLFEPETNVNSPDWTRRILLISNHVLNDASVISLNWFLEKVYPYIDPSINIKITGKGDYSKWKREFRDKKNITFLGFVEKKILDGLLKRCILVLNTKISGSGISIHALEAISFNCVVVSTTFGNSFAPYIPSSDNPKKIAEIINIYANTGIINNVNLDYNAFYNSNLEAFIQFINS